VPKATLHFSFSASRSWIFRISKYIWCSKCGNNNHKEQRYNIRSSFIIIISVLQIFENLIVNYLSDILSANKFYERSINMRLLWIYSYAVVKYHVWKYIFKYYTFRYYIDFNYYTWSRVSTYLTASPFCRVIPYPPHFANEMWMRSKWENGVVFRD